jgi:RNA polymerase sigma-70 factor (ECF subfamily)
MRGRAATDSRDERARKRTEELFRAHYGAVSAYARRRVPAESVDDVVAETFLVAWRRADQVPDDSLPWLLAVARNVLLTQQRGARRRSALSRRIDGASHSRGPAAHPDEDASGPVSAALARLAAKDREAITLIAWDGLRPAEAARVLQQSPATFRVRFHRAKRRLRRELDRSTSQLETVASNHPVVKEMTP